MLNVDMVTASHMISPLTDPEWYVRFVVTSLVMEPAGSNSLAARQSDDMQPVVATHCAVSYAWFVSPPERRLQV